jgi:outer membrane protein assembly factor BamE (lipoprotein component of BamABCDE complex)
VQAAIRDGQILLGMTKEQVTVSLGYPRLDKTASLDDARWFYTTWQDEIYAVEFDAEQRVRRVVATPDVQSQVLGSK